MPAASALARPSAPAHGETAAARNTISTALGVIPTAVGGALGSCGTYLLTLAWPEAWGGPLRSALAAGVIGCLVAGIAVGMPKSTRPASPRAILRDLLLGGAAGTTGLGLLVTPGLMETTAWRGVTYLTVAAVATVTAFVFGTVIGGLVPGHRPATSPAPGHRRSSHRATSHRPPTYRPPTHRPATARPSMNHPSADRPSADRSPRRHIAEVSADPADPDAITIPLRPLVRPIPHRHRSRAR